MEDPGTLGWVFWSSNPLDRIVYFQSKLTNSVLSAVKTLFVLLFKSDLDLRKSLLSNLGSWRFMGGSWAWICILSMKSCRCQTVKPPHTTHINMHTYTKPSRTALTPIQSLILSVKKQLWQSFFFIPLVSYCLSQTSSDSKIIEIMDVRQG